MKRLVIGLLAHVDSGKTTLAEGLLYTAGEIRKICRYFRARRKMALPDAGWQAKLEYFFLTSGSRIGFYLSRLTSLPRKNGTWLRG